MKLAIDLDRDALQSSCRRWKITELAFFGSILRQDFRPDGDVDVLVSFAPDARWSLFDSVAMQDELERMFGRKVDLVSRRAVERSANRFRREAILSSAQPWHVAR